MTESECEIEYLDEDADIIQQLVQSQPVQSTLVPILEEKVRPPLLVERPKKRKRISKKTEESDDDYDPMEDMVPSPPSPKTKKKKPIVVKKHHKQEKDPLVSEYSRIKKLNIKKVMRENRVLNGKEQYDILKKLNLKIPDFDDPLCLPVKAVNTDIGDSKRLQTWNNVCLEHFKHCDTILKPERGETNSSSRTVVLRNVFNKRAGKRETTVWSKTCVVNEDGDKKSEIFQCVLPNFKEKKTLNISNLVAKKTLRSSTPTVDEVILRKEEHKNSETLVVYKLQTGISSVFTLVDKRKQENDDEEIKREEKSKEEEEVKMYLKEITCCRMCVHCFQESWRGLKKTKGPIVCPICARSFVTVYSLLTHIKSHATADVQRYKRVISLSLSEIVGYHYKCRMCRQKCTSIKDMREHVDTHRGTELFMCEVGNHLSR